jgi:hypothetical protein
MKMTKVMLLSASAIVMGLGFAPAAQAFDNVDWSWNNDVNSKVNISVYVKDHFDISGLVQVENIQMNIGDVTAVSSVDGVSNFAPEGGFIKKVVKDGVDLPLVDSSATAVANNQSIESTVAVNLHGAQYNMGGLDSIYNRSKFARPDFDVEVDAEAGNAHTDILLTAVLGGILGIIEPGQVSATSDVTNILNAQVSSAATAVGNNLSVDLQASTPGDAFLIADITQLNFADVYASSNVSNVGIGGYTNLGAIDGALVKSVATAVGNNVSITVKSPSIGE